MTVLDVLLLFVKILVIYFSVGGLVVALLLAGFCVHDRLAIRVQARRLQREVDRHLEEVSR